MTTDLHRYFRELIWPTKKYGPPPVEPHRAFYDGLKLEKFIISAQRHSNTWVLYMAADERNRPVVYAVDPDYEDWDKQQGPGLATW